MDIFFIIYQFLHFITFLPNFPGHYKLWGDCKRLLRCPGLWQQLEGRPHVEDQGTLCWHTATSWCLEQSNYVRQKQNKFKVFSSKSETNEICKFVMSAEKVVYFKLEICGTVVLKSSFVIFYDNEVNFLLNFEQNYFSNTSKTVKIVLNIDDK